MNIHLLFRQKVMTRSRFFVPLLFSGILFFLSSVATPLHSALEAPDEGSRIAEGQELINNGSYPEAISLFREISLTSDSPGTRASALFFIGSIYGNYLDQPEKAIACFNDLILMYPESPAAPDALFTIGHIFFKIERYREAQKAFEDYVVRYPHGMRLPSAKAWAANAGKKCGKGSDNPLSQKTLSALDPGIRVLLARKAGRIDVDSDGVFTVHAKGQSEPAHTGRGPLTFSKSGRNLILNGNTLDGDTFSITSRCGWFSLGGKRYRGALVVHLKPQGITAVNHLDIESYLYGVVPKEMSPLWSPQALEAQAIASRTYALYIREKQVAAGKDYDLEATTASQVYGGLDGEKEQTGASVDNTRGMVMAQGGKLIISYFHANSGGYTESALNVWGADIPYLRSVEDSFSTIQPDNIWEYTVSYKEMGRLFRKNLTGRDVRRIEAQSKSPSGRILSFLVCSDKKQVKILGNSFRMRLGPVNLKSTLFDVFPGKTGIRFRGTGYGHGVGMSQWGAHRMGQAGYSREDILKHYYRDVDILTVRYL